MGCCFYLRNEDGSEGQHIGKRSAAGRYCFDCDVTLCTGGKEEAHNGQGRDDEWYDACPKCGAKPVIESFNNSSVGLELGFNDNPTEKKTGVRGCSSFRWAVDPIRFISVDFPKLGNYPVTDEYGKTYKIGEFVEMVKVCPIQFYDSIGQEFN